MTALRAAQNAFAGRSLPTSALDCLSPDRSTRTFLHNTYFLDVQYTMHFELARGINPVAIYCFVQSKINVVYDRMLKEVKRMIILAFPERKYC